MASDMGEIEQRLTNLQALTDADLTQLDVNDLLVELLNRLREILDTDTAAVLLLDEASGDLVARAACGIEEEVRQGVRVPFGHGFAGRIAAERAPIRLERVDATTVANPILWEKGIRVMLGVPLLSGDRVLGVLHVGRLDQRRFTDEDVELLQVAAERIAGATQARQLAIERATAALLERSLVPSVLPACPGLSIAARYVPAEERSVGGDWYDVFTLPSGQLWIAVGDVAGHGLGAAVVMGRIRSALRAYAMLELSPSEVLDLVDRKVSHFEIGTIATVVLAVLDPPFDSVTLAVAGHPPPAIVTQHWSSFACVDPDPPLGTTPQDARSCTNIPFEPGAVMAFYTDGLVERRGEMFDTGLERLRQAVSTDEPRTVVRDVMRKLVAGEILEDDVALVVIRRDDD